MNINGVEVEALAEGSFEQRAQERPAVVPVKFWTTYENNPADILNPIAKDWVRWAKRGNKGAETVDKVERIRKHDKAIWEVIKPYYEHWKGGREAPVNGTPLEKLPGMTEEMLERFRALHLRSIEDAASMTEGDMERIGFGARDVKERAKAYLERNPHQATQAAVAATNGEVKTLKQQVAALTAMLMQNQGSKGEAVPDEVTEEAPKRRGRPPKDADAAE